MIFNTWFYIPICTLLIGTYLQRDIELTINSIEFPLDQKARLIVEVTLENFSKNNYILYGYGITKLGHSPESKYDANSTGCGNVVFIRTLDGELVYPMVSISGEFKTREGYMLSLDSLITIDLNLFTNTKIILTKHSKICSSLEFDLSNYQLKKGEYTIRIIYYSGLLKWLDNRLILEDQRAYSATKFSGWVSSNSARLIVK